MYPNETNKTPVILHKALSFQVVGVCFEVHNTHGRYCRERQYGDEVEKVLMAKHVSYRREANLQVLDPAGPKGNFADFIIEGTILLELKAKDIVTKEDYYQVQRYLWASGLDLAILVNFRQKYIHPKRILRTGGNSHHSNRDSYH